MTKDVLDLIRQHGPGLTTELIAALEAQGITAAAARQRITRAQSGYKRLAGLRFAKNARFVYLEDQFGDQKYWDALERGFAKSGQSYWAAVIGLRARGGACPVSMFPTVCGAPLARDRQLSPDRIIDRLTAVHLLELVTDEASGEPYVQFKPHSYFKLPSQNIHAVLLAEQVALFAIRDWARKIGFGSYNKFAMRGDEQLPVVSSVGWDISAPSFMRPLVSARTGKLKPGFFVCDINLTGPIDEEAVALFVRKHDMASAPANVAPIFPFLVGEIFEGPAIDLARQRGVVATTVSHLFGEETSKALRDLIGLLTDAGATAAVNPEQILKVISTLTKIEGAANNIRGALFELVVGNLVKDVEGGYLVAGEKRRDYETGRSAEIDVVLNRPEDAAVLVIECKSKIPGARVGLDEVTRWYTDRVPLIRRILATDRRYEKRDFRFEIWSNGLFDQRALEWLKTQPTTFSDYSVGWRDGAAMKTYASKAKSSSVRKILNEHYFHHPLAKRSTPIIDCE